MSKPAIRTACKRMWVIASFVNDDVISSTHATGRLYKYPLSKYKNMLIKLPHECLSNVQQAQDSGLATDICSICKVKTEIFANPWLEIEADKPLLANLTTPQHDNVGWRVLFCCTYNILTHFYKLKCEKMRQKDLKVFLSQ